VTGVRRAAFALLMVAGLGACSEPPPPPPQDTALPDTPPEPPPQPAPAAQTKIGMLPLTRRAPLEGSCRTQGSGVEPRYAYEGDEFPKRSITVGSGAAARSFVPTFIEIRASQAAAAGLDDIETIYVLFGPTGQIETGTRQYFNTATPPVRETGGLLPGDTSALKDMALFVLEKCRPRPA
jgi:hypothetical protein